MADWTRHAEDAGGFYDQNGDCYVVPDPCEPRWPTPEQEAAWRGFLDRLKPRTDEAPDVYQPGDVPHIRGALGSVLSRLASGSGVDLGRGLRSSANGAGVSAPFGVFGVSGVVLTRQMGIRGAHSGSGDSTGRETGEGGE
jgi:hypothetical protein